MRYRKSVLAGLFAFAALCAAEGHAEDRPVLPFAAAGTHLGVSSCGGSSCHGALEPWDGSTVLQNEFVTWQEKDPHAKAYKTLQSEESKRIARNLGLPNAYEADMCLDCHADNVPVDRRAKGFEIADGVGCESCHGGGERWLGIHVSGRADHAENLSAGLFPTENAEARARLCLSCHFGDKDRVITHRIMGAGHPRLAFELDTYSMTQPAHFAADADYVRRKGELDHVKIWAIGQVVATESLLDAMLDPARNSDGIFPEFVFYDCHACHHPMSNVRWEPRETHAISPGIPRLNDANLIIMTALLDQIDSSRAKQIRDRTRALHQASLKGRDATLEAARALREQIDPLLDRLNAWTPSRQELRGILSAVIARGLKGDFVDYAAAEQATMAMSAILDAMARAGALSEPQHMEMVKLLDGAYATILKDESYNPRQFLAVLQDIEAAVPRS